jgi:hypothetical protein
MAIGVAGRVALAPRYRAATLHQNALELAWNSDPILERSPVISSTA